MSIEYLSRDPASSLRSRFGATGSREPKDEVLLAVLPKEPQLRHELETINETVSSNDDYDVVIDFSRVEVLTSSSISNLVILHNLLCERGRQLILCNVTMPTRGLFNVVGLDGFFSLAEDKFAALARLQGKIRNPKSETRGFPQGGVPNKCKIQTPND